MMGRKRTSGHDLPKHVYRRGNAFYYVRRHEGVIAWVPLGTDRNLVEAKLAVILANPSKIESEKEHRRKRVERRTALRDQIMRRDTYMCVYCGAVENLVIDHVIPVASGGADHVKNLVVACAACNTAKGGRHVLDFLDYLATRRR